MLRMIFRWEKRKETTMKKQWKLIARGFLLAGLFVSAAPARAQNEDERIKALERRLSQLDEQQVDMKKEATALLQELSQLKEQQIEMKNEATAAAAALPTFTYRPGNGLSIEAADQSWAFRTSIEAHFRLLFESGLSEAGRETGGVMGRRFRPFFYYCIDNCLYEIEAGLDLDGFGTGNGKNATGTAPGSMLQRGVVYFHLERLNAYLPTFYAGMDGPASVSAYRQGSSAVGAQLEYDLLSRNNGLNTGRFGNGVGLDWSNIDLSPVGIPGRLPLVNVVYATIGEGDDGLQSFREQRSVSAYVNIEPLAQIKNKWIQGLGFEFGAWFCPNEPNRTPQNPQSIACNRLRIQDNGDGGRQSLFDSNVGGSGLTHFLMPGFSWTIGPYRLRAVGGFQRYDGNNSKVKGNDFLIGHDLFIWSPKGFLTGSASMPGSILLGTHFERTDVSCPIASCNNGVIAPGSTVPQFTGNRILLREWDMWYFLAPRMSIGATVAWFDAAHLRQAIAGATPAATAANIQAATNVARNLGCVSSHQHTIQSPGKGCDWVDFSVTWRYQF